MTHDDVTNLIFHLHCFYPDCDKEIQKDSNRIFKKRLSKEFALSIISLFNPLSFFKPVPKFGKVGVGCEDYWLHSNRIAIRNFIERQDKPINDYNFTEKENIFLGFKTCKILEIPNRSIA